MSSHRISFNPVPQPCNCPLYPCWFWRLRAWIAQAAASVILFISVCNRCLKKSQDVAVLALAVIVVFILFFPLFASAAPCAPTSATLCSLCADSSSTTVAYYSLAKVVRVIDGDTVLVHCLDKIPVTPTMAWPYSTFSSTSPVGIKVRMLCVDTPESVHPVRSRNCQWGRNAAKATTSRLQGRYVTLLYESNVQAYDLYGRLLAYVLVDGHNFSLELVERGLSPYSTSYGRSTFFHSIFREFQANAYAQRRGLWADPSIEPAYHRYLLEPD